jgi:putative transposon-encoded protein
MARFELNGEEMIKKDVTKHSETSSHVFVPKDWRGREVAVILLESSGNEENIGGE